MNADDARNRSSIVMAQVEVLMSNKTLFEPLKFHSLAHQSVPCFMSALPPKAAAAVTGWRVS